MNWTVLYYSERVREQVFDLPADILSNYLRLLELLQEFGADLRLPHSRAMGNGLFELRPKGTEGIGRVFYCTQMDKHLVVLHSFVKKNARHAGERVENCPPAYEGSEKWISLNQSRTMKRLCNASWINPASRRLMMRLAMNMRCCGNCSMPVNKRD